jgi:hypothetical protein
MINFGDKPAAIREALRMGEQLGKLVRFQHAVGHAWLCLLTCDRCQVKAAPVVLLPLWWLDIRSLFLACCRVACKHVHTDSVCMVA